MVKKKKRIKKDPGILVRVWKQENGMESVKKFYIDRGAKTVDLDLWLTVETKTDIQCNYPAKIVEK